MVTTGLKRVRWVGNLLGDFRWVSDRLGTAVEVQGDRSLRLAGWNQPANAGDNTYVRSP